MPFVSRTRATFRSAEFGFFGVCVMTRVQTPRFCGEPSRWGVFVFAFTVLRPFRTSWFTVGMGFLRASFCGQTTTAGGHTACQPGRGMVAKLLGSVKPGSGSPSGEKTLRRPPNGLIFPAVRAMARRPNRNYSETPCGEGSTSCDHSPDQHLCGACSLRPCAPRGARRPWAACAGRKDAESKRRRDADQDYGHS